MKVSADPALLQDQGIPVLRVSTASFPQKRRVEMFRELYGRDVLRLDMTPDPDVPFYAEMTLLALPGLALVSAQSSMVCAARTRQLVTDGNDDLLIQIGSDEGAASQLGREVQVEGGGAIALSAADIGHSTYKSGSRLLCLGVPRSALRQRMRDPGDALMRPIGRASKSLRLLVGYLGLLRNEATLMTPEVRSLAVGHVHDLLALVFGPACASSQSAGLSAARLHAVKAEIARRLDHARLSIDMIAAQQKVSPRYVQMLFKRDGGTFSDFVLTQRLARANQLLSRPSGPRTSITSIALACGFDDLSYFDRAFRRRFGCTPSELRASRRPGP